MRVVTALDNPVMTLAAAPHEFIEPLPPFVTQTDRHHEDWAHRAAQTIRADLERAGLLADVVTEPGDPKELLIQQAEQWQADCIFLGARGLTRMERMLLGSVSSAVASRAHCSVEVVRAPA